MDSAPARLRKAFKYPTDDDAEDSHEEMDEEGKQHLITLGARSATNEPD
jgi:hypothetical protein